MSFVKTPPPARITTIQPLPSESLGALVVHGVSSGAEVRALCVAIDSSETLRTPWQASDSAIVILGLKPGSSYVIQVEQLYDGRTVPGQTVDYAVPPLPIGLQQVSISMTGNLSGGYSMAPIGGIDGHGYLIIFDSVGIIRWFRDFGSQVVFATTQQKNGHITAFVGSSTGFNAASGTYVEVTRSGDSVRSISALGSDYTDPHELLQSFDRDGNRRADYLFGYSFRTFDRTQIGGGPSDAIAVHQLLRINLTGTVDTLIAGDEQWGPADDVAPPLIADLDHPNSIDFDFDGGVIVSYRNLSAIVKVNSRTYQFAWQFGGTHNQFTLIGDPFGGFDSQHTARVLPSGHLLIFDNGWNHSPQQSRAVEYAIDTVAKTATMVWQYSADPPIFNDFTGSAQRLENGNTVVAFTRHGTVDEVAPDGTLLGRATIESARGRIATPYRVTRVKSLYSFERP
ncbi:MAG: aryl-sulfate sulfotransferase [Gemmatimonadaceae bacterium]